MKRQADGQARGGDESGELGRRNANLPERGHDHHHENEAVEDIGDVGIDGLIGAPAVQRVDESRADQARYPGAYDIDGDGAEQGEGELDSIC